MDRSLNRLAADFNTVATSQVPQSISNSQSAFKLVGDTVAIIIGIEMIRETVVVVVELTGPIVPIAVLEPVGQPVVIVIGIGSIPDAIVVVIVSVGRQAPPISSRMSSLSSSVSTASLRPSLSWS